MKSNRIILSIFLCLFGYFYGQTVVRQIKPSDTDPLIQTFDLDSHYVYINPSVNPQNTLVVHLPGSYGEPKRATLFGSLAADLGFHSIGLMYPNIPTVGSICTNSNDVNCFEKTRGEIIQGIDYSTEIDIPFHESIFSRLIQLLTFLHATYPSENWNQFLTSSNNLNFEKIIFSGHSQGGGHAALIAKYYPLARALCFSAPKDWSNMSNSPAVWLDSSGWITDPSRIYVFNHTLDVHNQQLQIWNAMGLNSVGSPMNVDLVNSPYQLTRQLTSSFVVPAGDEHASTIQDNKTPKINGIPVFLPVWTYMLLNLDQSSVSEQEQNDISVNPNPMSDLLKIEGITENATVQLLDQSGKIVLSRSGFNETILLDVSKLENGVYFLDICTDVRRVRKKVAKY
ncbi:MAG: BPSS1187 family protein [Crocinitomicaceae bacterium]